MAAGTKLTIGGERPLRYRGTLDEEFLLSGILTDGRYVFAGDMRMLEHPENGGAICGPHPGHLYQLDQDLTDVDVLLNGEVPNTNILPGNTTLDPTSALSNTTNPVSWECCGSFSDSVFVRGVYRTTTTSESSHVITTNVNGTTC